MAVTLEMRKTLLVIGGFCIFLVLVEECINSGSVSKRLSSSFESRAYARSEAGLATDELGEGHSRNERRKILLDEERTDNQVTEDDREIERVKEMAESRRRKENEMAESRRRKEKEMADQRENERRKEESELEVQRKRDRKAKEVVLHAQGVIRMREETRVKTQQPRLEEEGSRDLLVEHKKKEAEKVLEDDDEEEDVDTDVEDEKPVDGSVDKEDKEDEEDLDDVPDEEEEMEEERLEKSPYIVTPEQEQKLTFISPTMLEMKTISEWRKLTPYKHSFQRCRYNMCRWEENNSLADAVLFRAAAIRTWIIKPFPRKPGSRWIMYTNDPAIKNYGLDRDDVGANFNATSTYQLHSDYPRLFGQLRRVKPPGKDFGRIFDGKTRQIAWFVSHCSTWSKRELYIERMRKIIPVDVFGACGNLTCGASHFRGNDTNVCLPMLSERYKYYLAFENSFCKDYVSEKFFKLFQGVDVIPVVQGGFDYHKYMPSKVFVDSSDFSTPEDLARHLVNLSNDKYRYVKMLKRKARWTYKPADPLHCVVCEKLHRDTRVSHHTDMVAVFNGKPPECFGPRWLQRAEEDESTGDEENEEDDEE